jgi:tetratricopeptide (TPR) repeat protein
MFIIGIRFFFFTAIPILIAGFIVQNLLTWRASILQAQGKLDEALIIRDEILQKSRHVFKEDSDSTFHAMLLKADCLRQLKQFDEALVLFDQVLDFTKRYLAQRQLGENQPAFATRLNYKAQCLEEMGRPGEALVLCDQALGIFMKTMGENNPRVANSLFIKGKCLDDLNLLEKH